MKYLKYIVCFGLVCSLSACESNKTITNADELVAQYQAKEHGKYRCEGKMDAKISMSYGIFSFDIPVRASSQSTVTEDTSEHEISATYELLGKKVMSEIELFTEVKDDHSEVKLVVEGEEITFDTDLVSLVDKIDAKTFANSSITYDQDQKQYQVVTTLKEIVGDYERIRNLLKRFISDEGIYDFTFEQIMKLIESAKDSEVIMVFDAETLDLLEVKSDQMIFTLLLDDEGSSEMEMNVKVRFVFDPIDDILEERIRIWKVK